MIIMTSSMKHTFRYILSAFVLLLPVMANAQQQIADPPLYDDYKVGNGVATGKDVDGPVNDLYTLTLETFATGLTTVVDLTKPADIVLVLDVSGSMDDSYGSYSYVPRARQAYTYNGYTSTYYYKHTDGNYYAVSRTGTSGSRRLRFTVIGRYWYLSGTDTAATTTEPSGVGNSATIWTGVLYERSNTKMAALKAAVMDFIDEVHKNALFDQNGDPRQTPLTNQISIVKFADSRYYQDNADDLGDSSPNVSNIQAGNHTYGQNWNYTEVRINFTSARTDSGVNDLKNAVRTMNAGGGTASHYGMRKAEFLLAQQNIVTRDSKKTVVFFTDGIPQLYSSDGFRLDYANPAIASAKRIKYDGVTVYSVGIFSNLGNNATNVNTFMNYVSSNYPNADDMGTPGDDGNADGGFYKNASDGGLGNIFKDIAGASGGSASTIPGETMLVDEVSTSFEVPSTFTAQDVVVYTRDAKADGTGWKEGKTPLTKVILPANYDLTTPPVGTEEFMTDENKVGVYLHDGKLMILGFNYSKPDSEGANGTSAHPYNGNWVGWRDNGVTCAGKELVIEFKIEAIDGVTGGDGTNTNKSPVSGVYVYNSETGYTNINPYPYPQTDLPINIVIEKYGLRRGESATIQIYRAPIKKNAFDEYTGKPAPDLTNGWENFTKVIITNTTNQEGTNVGVTKVLRCLDPSYVYRLEEDNWGWGYVLDTYNTDTSKKESNPFIFHNTLNPDAVKHAEAVSINIFGDNYGSKSYKASKVKSYDD